MHISDQHRSFASFYTLDPETAGNGAASAIKAGYAADSAKQTAYRLLRRDDVRAEIDRLNREAIGEYATASRGR